MEVDDEILPPEIEGTCEEFHQSLLRTDSVLKKLLSVPHETLDENLTTLDKARLNLTLCYAVDSLFWALLMVQGVSPREHEVKKELDRVRQYMGKLKEIEEKEIKPEMKLNKDAAKRFVRSALWEPTEPNEANETTSVNVEEKDSDKQPDGEPNEVASVKKKLKRKKSRQDNRDDEPSGDISLKRKSVKQRKQQNSDETTKTDGGTDTSQPHGKSTEDMESFRVHEQTAKSKKRKPKS